QADGQKGQFEREVFLHNRTVGSFWWFIRIPKNLSSGSCQWKWPGRRRDDENSSAQRKEFYSCDGQYYAHTFEGCQSTFVTITQKRRCMPFPQTGLLLYCKSQCKGLTYIPRAAKLLPLVFRAPNVLA